MSKKCIEIELRGTLWQQEYRKLKRYLDKESESCQNDDKTSYFFVTENKVLKVVEQGSSWFLVLKKWDETNSVLEELQVTVQNDYISDMLDMLMHLGYTKINKVQQKRTNYSYKWAEISLKYTKDWWYHFEIESTTDKIEEADSIKKKLLIICSSLNIIPMTPTQIKEKILEINAKHGLI